MLMNVLFWLAIGCLSFVLAVYALGYATRNEPTGAMGCEILFFLLWALLFAPMCFLPVCWMTIIITFGVVIAVIAVDSLIYLIQRRTCR